MLTPSVIIVNFAIPKKDLSMAGQKQHRGGCHYQTMIPYLEHCVFPNINWRGIWTHHESRWECVKVAYAILQLEEYNPHFM